MSPLDNWHTCLADKCWPLQGLFAGDWCYVTEASSAPIFVLQLLSRQFLTWCCAEMVWSDCLVLVPGSAGVLNGNAVSAAVPVYVEVFCPVFWLVRLGVLLAMEWLFRQKCCDYIPLGLIGAGAMGGPIILMLASYWSISYPGAMVTAGSPAGDKMLTHSQ